MRPGGVIDAASMFTAVSGLSIPKFWFGLLLMYLFALKLGWFPTFGYGGWWYLVLPAVTLGVSPLALLARTTRAAVLEVINADFVRTARSKGMSETRVVRWHVVRNVAVIVLTTLGLQFGSLMGQAVVVEKLFSWPGIGSLLVDSVFARDIPAVQGCILLDRSVLPHRQHAGRHRLRGDRPAHQVLMKLGANLAIGGALFLTAVVVGVFAPWLAHTDPVMDANLMVAEEPPSRRVLVRHRRTGTRHLFPRAVRRAHLAHRRHLRAAHQHHHRHRPRPLAPGTGAAGGMISSPGLRTCCSQSRR